MPSRLEGPLVRELRAYAETGRDLPRTPARRHHFVPAFLLARFAAPAEDRRGWLRQLNMVTGKPGRTTPNDACFEIDLYTQEPEDEGVDAARDTRVETLFSIVEKHAAPALARLVEDPTGLTAQDRETLSYFLAFQYTRTPPAIAQIDEAGQVIADLYTGFSLERADFADTYRARVDPKATDEEAEAARQEMRREWLDGEVIVEAGNVALFAILTTADKLAETFFGLEWVVVKGDACEGEFVTSDRALAIIDPTPRFPWSGDAPASSPNVQTTVPLDPTHALVLQPGLPRVGIMPATDVVVSRINLRTYGWANRFIYGRSQKVLQDVRTAAKRRPRDVPIPRISRQVILEEADPDDPTVGREHARRGWPRGLWHTDDDGRDRFMAYHVLEPGDKRGNHAALVEELGKRGGVQRHSRR